MIPHGEHTASLSGNQSGNSPLPKGVGYYYGLIPQIYSGAQVAGLFAKHARRKGMVGDGDPLEICVLSEKRFRTATSF